MSNNRFSKWLGNHEISHDDLSENLVKRISATFGVKTPLKGEPLPYLWHWAFFQEPVSDGMLGHDGHPALGEFMPLIEGRNRMWAGGRVEFYYELLVGVPAERRSTIIDIVQKEGNSGTLLFVTVKHEYWQQSSLCISEEQDIVYRPPTSPRASSEMEMPDLNWEEEVNLSTTMLFRYSAVTFNGHRIHYDYPYVTSEEGYDGLVIHGPLIATLLLNGFLKRGPKNIPIRFEYRGIRPLIQGTAFKLGGCYEAENQTSLWAFNNEGPAQKARVTFKEV